MDVVSLMVGVVATIVVHMQQGASGGDLFDVGEQSQPVSVVPQEKLLLPDMQPSTPEELYIEETSDGRTLRFSSTFINVGAGPLEFFGESDTEEGVTRASQRIYMRDGDRALLEVGEFVLHPTHEHWHIEDYIEFQLWSSDGEEMLSSTGKMSFCIWDEKVYNFALNHASKTREYSGCDGEIQGLSVGWSDTYGAEVDGQELDITGISDGIYIARTVINPEGRILEENYSNNTVDLSIEIEGSMLRVLED